MVIKIRNPHNPHMILMGILDGELILISHLTSIIFLKITKRLKMLGS